MKRERRVVNKRFGLARCVYELESLLLNSKYLRDRLYQGYLGLGEEDKEGFRSEIRRVLKRYLLGNKLEVVLAKCVVKEKEGVIEIDTESSVYRYCKNDLYLGDARGMLIRMYSVLKREKEIEEFMKLKGVREKRYERVVKRKRSRV